MKLRSGNEYVDEPIEKRKFSIKDKLFLLFIVLFSTPFVLAFIAVVIYFVVIYVVSFICWSIYLCLKIMKLRQYLKESGIFFIEFEYLKEIWKNLYQ